MTNHEYVDLAEKTKEIFSMLDAEELPETAEYLSGFIFDNEPVPEGPYELATNLTQCDKLQLFPQFLINFITELYEVEIEAGNADAMNDLGAHYYSGEHGFEQNFSKAVKLYRLAAEHGNRNAQENLGYCYYYGRNVPVDYEKAFHFFALGAFAGELVSLYKIGDMYLNGHYVRKDETEAFSIYARCLQAMTEEDEEEVAGPVYLRLANLLLDGRGVKEDVKGALILYQKAEPYLYDMVMNGDVMYKKSLQAAIDGQAKARAKLNEELPDNDWTIRD